MNNTFPTAYFAKVKYIANLLLHGPDSITTDSFWGERHVMLFIQSNPIIKGLVSSKVLYSNVNDNSQDTFIIQETVWNAESTYSYIVSALNNYDDSTIEYYPRIQINYSQINYSKLDIHLKKISEVSVPFTLSNMSEWQEKSYKLYVSNSDRSFLGLCWYSQDPKFEIISELWQEIWELINISKVPMTEKITQNWIVDPSSIVDLL